MISAEVVLFEKWSKTSERLVKSATEIVRGKNRKEMGAALGTTVKHNSENIRNFRRNLLLDKSIQVQNVLTNRFRTSPLLVEKLSGDFIVNLREWLVPHNDPFDHVKHVPVAVIHKL